MNILMMVDVRIIRRPCGKLRERADQTVDARLLCRHINVITRIKVLCLRIAVGIAENVSNARLDAALNHQKISQKESAKGFVKVIKHDDIFKRHAIAIHFSGFILERMFVAADQGEISDLRKHTLSGIFI